MPGRAKGKRFVISGKERLDVGLHEDEFLLQAVFYCMGAGPNPAQQPESCPPAAHVGAPSPAKPYPTAGPRQQAGPNPACRPTMLALPRRQNLIPPPGHANRPTRILSAGRPCWRLSAGKTLSHRLTTPTGRPESRLPAAHVGALRRQNLIPPSGHANSPAQIPLGSRPCWRRPAGKTLSHRRATPTGRPESCLPAVHVGVSPPSKPYPTAGPRQQVGLNLACRAPMLPLPLAGGRRL